MHPDWKCLSIVQPVFHDFFASFKRRSTRPFFSRGATAKTDLNALIFAMNVPSDYKSRPTLEKSTDKFRITVACWRISPYSKACIQFLHQKSHASRTLSNQIIMEATTNADNKPLVLQVLRRRRKNLPEIKTKTEYDNQTLINNDQDWLALTTFRCTPHRIPPCWGFSVGRWRADRCTCTRSAVDFRAEYCPPEPRRDRARRRCRWCFLAINWWATWLACRPESREECRTPSRAHRTLPAKTASGAECLWSRFFVACWSFSNRTSPQRQSATFGQRRPLSSRFRSWRPLFWWDSPAAGVSGRESSVKSGEQGVKLACERLDWSSVSWSSFWWR